MSTFQSIIAVFVAFIPLLFGLLMANPKTSKELLVWQNEFAGTRPHITKRTLQYRRLIGLILVAVSFVLITGLVWNIVMGFVTGSKWFTM